VKNKLKVLDLFSGLGGFSLGLERTGHFETVAFCDNNKYSKLVIDKHWKGIKIYDDIKEITKEKFTTDGIEAPDIITGGVPCQPFSVAGKQKGTSDDRYLWPEMFRIIKAFKSKFVIVENVRGIVNIENGMVFETVCSDLESEGYEVQAFNIPAAGVGAPHRRERIWFIAVREDATNTESKRTWKDNGGIRQGSSRISGGQGTTAAEDVANTNESRSGERKISRDINNERGRPSETRGESLQSEDRQTRTDNIGSGSEDVADTNSGLRRGRRTVGQSREDEDRFLHSKEEEQAREHLRSETVGRSSIRGETDVENSNNNGLEGRLFETRNETITGKKSSFNRSEDTDNFSRRSDGRGNQTEPKINGEIQRLRDGNEKESSRTTGVRGLHERTDDSSRSLRENKNQEDDNRTLVQTRQGGIQSSVSRGLGTDQTLFENNQIQQGDDNSSLNRMERRETDVANTDTRLSNGENEKIQSRGQTSISSSEGTNKKLANTNSEGLEGFREGSRELSKTFFATDSSEERQRTMDKGWWSVEPNVGRVAHGVSGRVHRLKGLGNSIIPQIVEEIGYAIIKAMK